VDSDEPIPGTHEVMARYDALEEEAAYWYSGDDPVLRDIVRTTLKAYAPLLHEGAQPRDARDAVARLEDFLQRTQDASDVAKPSGHVEQDENGEVRFIPSPEPFRPDSVDHLMAPSIKPMLKLAHARLVDALRLATLHEIKAGRFHVAVKAYGHWKELVRGKAKGGKKSGEAKKEENAKRDERMRQEALRRHTGGEAPDKIVKDFAERHGLTPERIGQILREHPNWPRRTRRPKRSHT
jgi:hypothetical protein